ncbi:hypothetical protein ACF3MZ_01930 [Paenibacillaceae bacterium WGS1546]|uniref:hypothetical protein n=1 Tax=Cohnella sp. WGS1546 TaxID=3366810 RepID=UPI00372D7ACC
MGKKGLRFVCADGTNWSAEEPFDAAFSIRFTHAAQHFAEKAKNLASVQEVVLCGLMAAGDLFPGDIDLAVVLSMNL